MRTTTLLFCLLCAAAAFGQSIGGLSPIESSSFRVPDNAIRAFAQPMPLEQNLLGTSSITSAQGEMPLWETPTQRPIPLGDIARELRKEHATAKKARMVLVK